MRIQGRQAAGHNPAPRDPRPETMTRRDFLGAALPLVAALGTSAWRDVRARLGRPARALRGGHPIFRAIAILERRASDSPPRVRFEWTPRDGVSEYLLVGAWTSHQSWTVERRGFRVDRRNASTWDDRLVTFEVSLPPGNHSWRLMPVGRAHAVEPAGERAQIWFDLR